MKRIKGKARARANRKKKNKQKNDFFVRKKNLLGEIRKYDNSDLLMEGEPVVSTDEVGSIFKKMKQVLNLTDNGVGLAASQIGIAKAMVVIKSDVKSNDITCMINPEIVSSSGKMKYGREGCLSYPKTFALIERLTSIEISYHDENWKKHIIEYEEGNILGIVIQHEMEHLKLGHCQVYDWWKDPEGKQKEFEEKFEKAKEQNDSQYDVVESEDRKKEREENEMEDERKCEDCVTQENCPAKGEPCNDYVGMSPPLKELTEAIEEAKELIKDGDEKFTELDKVIEDLEK